MEMLGIDLFDSIDARERRKAVQALRDYLDKNRPNYDLAREKWMNLAWCQKALKECREALIDVESYSPSNAPHEAVYRVAQASLRLSKVFTQLAIMEAYEANRALLDSKKDAN